MKPNAFLNLFAVALVLLATNLFSVADELFPGGNFEAPVVEARTTQEKGGDPSNGGKGPAWLALTHKPDEAGGKFTAGLTNEIAHTGKQCLFIECEKLTGPYQSVSLQAAPVAVAPRMQYRVGIWGRLDEKNPLNVTEHSLAAKVQVDFFKADKVTPAGDSAYAGQSLPGAKGRPPLFSAQKWSEFWMEVATPEEAAFVMVTWRWETGGEKGEINGVMYFDDASVQGAPASAAPSSPATK